LGFYHTTAYGRPSLALDLLEEFRHSVIDRLALNLFNQGIVSQDDFRKVAEAGIYLNDSGKRKFFQYYEKVAGKYIGAAATKPVETGVRTRYQNRIKEIVKIISGDEAFKTLSSHADEDFDV